MTKVTRYNPLFHDWFEGRPYNYGDEPPRYPVPAVFRGWTINACGVCFFGDAASDRPTKGTLIATISGHR